jgi:hypothetical protein
MIIGGGAAGRRDAEFAVGPVAESGQRRGGLATTRAAGGFGSARRGSWRGSNRWWCADRAARTVRSGRARSAATGTAGFLVTPRRRRADHGARQPLCPGRRPGRCGTGTVGACTARRQPNLRTGQPAGGDGSAARDRRNPTRQHGDDGPGPARRRTPSGAARDRRSGAAPREGGRVTRGGARRLGRRRGGEGAADTEDLAASTFQG